MIKEHNSVMAMDVHAFMAWPCLRDTTSVFLCGVYCVLMRGPLR